MRILFILFYFFKINGTDRGLRWRRTPKRLKGGKRGPTRGEFPNPARKKLNCEEVVISKSTRRGLSSRHSAVVGNSPRVRHLCFFQTSLLDTLFDVPREFYPLRSASSTHFQHLYLRGPLGEEPDRGKDASVRCILCTFFFLFFLCVFVAMERVRVIPGQLWPPCGDRNRQ